MFNIKVDWCIILHHLVFLICSYLLLFRCYGNQLWFFKEHPYIFCVIFKQAYLSVLINKYSFAIMGKKNKILKKGVQINLLSNKMQYQEC
jgi:hypothetical protein